MVFNCLVVEDETPAQKVLQKYIGDISQLKLIKICDNALDAMEVLRENHIHILFLDIHLPKLTGINFLRSLKKPPQTIFTTAYSEHAVEGFDLDATDYLLKPFSFERFLKAVNRSIDRIEAQSGTTARKRSSENISPDKLNDSDDNFVFFKSDKRIYKIDLDQLLYIQSLKDYVRLVTDDNSYLILQTLKHWEKILPSKKFMRSHKSYIINLNRIDSINGNVIFLGKYEIPIGRHYRDHLLTEIENKSIN